MIKKGAIIFVFLFFFSSLASAQIIVTEQPKEIYNYGDSASVSMTLKPLNSVTDIFSMDLICEGQEINFYKNGISLSSGQEKKIDASLIFSKGLIGEIKGDCVIKGILGEEYVLTNEFVLSDKIIISPEFDDLFTPGTSAIIKGNAIKENGQAANGFISLEIGSENDSNSITKIETINNGFFSINVTFPEKIKAGKSLMKLNAYEEEPNNGQTNKGFVNSNINIEQVPTSLEIITDKEIEPGKILNIKSILHDQTGESIDSLIKITIRNNKSRKVKEDGLNSGEILELPILYNEKSSVWNIHAESEDFESDFEFLIIEKKEVNISLSEGIVTINNIGNIPYKDEVKIDIGDESIFLDVNLKVDESKEYKLKAPDGQYDVVVSSEDGKSLSQKMGLTGRVIDAKENNGARKVIFSFAWFFIIFILALAAYMSFVKGHNKTVFAYMPNFLKRKNLRNSTKMMPLEKKSKLISRNPAFVSLSIKGDKQKSSVVCLHVKNLEEIQKTKGNAREVLQKIIDFAEQQNAMTYESHGNLFFILAPLKTKTFKNESACLKISQAIKKTLKEHNRLFKQKIDFGISINNGIVILKPEAKETKFMSLGTFITTSKKISELSEEGEILLSREVANNLKSEIKAERFKDNEDIYSIKEIKMHSAENRKFVEELVKKWKKEEQSK